MKISELAKLTGVTVRTLHYYDEIGLLTPSEVTDAGYRIYDEAALERLYQIRFFRELAFSLDDIKEIMENPGYNKNEAVRMHRDLLVKKRIRLDQLIGLLDGMMKGEHNMSFKEFDMTEIEKAKKEYAAEVKERWGDTSAYAESESKTSGYDDAQWEALNGEGAAILQEFGECRGMNPDEAEAQALVRKWQDFITANFYNCTDEILSCLGLMYIGDERFTKNIDQYGEGTAQFMAAAIEAHCRK